MSNHPQLDKAALLQDVFEQIKKTNSLQRCPKCGGNLGSAVCAAGDRVPSWLDERIGDVHTHCWNACTACLIVWKLELFNWSDESNSGMIDREGHTLTLHAYANCGCQAPLLLQRDSLGKQRDLGICLVKSEKGHTRLGW